MNKKLIAIAVAGALAAPLTANAEVTVSGQLQQELVSWGGDAATLDGLVIDDGGEYGSTGSGNASEVAVSVGEDLGGGLKAIAKAGFNLQVDDTDQNGDNKFLAQRDAYVGISGGFGTVLVGSMSTPYKASTAGWDPFLATFAQARGNGGMSKLHNGYGENVLAYANKFGAVKVVAGINVDEAADPDDATSTRGDHGTHLSVNVPVGPVELAVAYLDSGADEGTAAKVGAKFTSGALGVALQYETMDATVGDGTQLYLNGTYAMGATTLALAYGQYSADETVGGTPDFTVDTTYMTLGVKHALSKATSVHAAYRVTSPDTDADSDETAIGVGLRVKF